MYFGDTDSRIVTKFGENWSLGKLPKSRLVLPSGNLGCAGVIRAPPLFCPHLADGAQNFLNVVARWLVHVCQIGPNWLWFAGVISKDWFFGPRSDYNIGWKPAMQLSPYNNFNCVLIYDSDLSVKCDSDSALLVVVSCDWSTCVCTLELAYLYLYFNLSYLYLLLEYLV